MLSNVRLPWELRQSPGQRGGTAPCWAQPPCVRISMVSGWQEVEEVCILLFFLGKWSDSYMFREMVKLGIKNLMNVDMV